MEPEEISLAISDLEVDDLVDILQALPEKITNDVLALMNSRDRGRIENVIDCNQCTYENENYHSYRRDKTSKRMIGLIYYE